MFAIDFNKYKSVHDLYDLGLCCLVAQVGNKDAMFEQINKAREYGLLSKKQAFDMRKAVLFAMSKPRKRTITLKEYYK